MSSSNKCTNCGSLELDTDPARGDVVCTNCGTVLEHSAIVSEVQFEENAHGGSSALGQFVSADSKGGARGFGQSFHTGLGKESREITYQNAKRGITNLAQQLRLNQHCIDTAFNFFKMALTRQLTRGRKNTHIIAACLYITCRTEGTAHMLIDFSDVLQIDVYELGRTYLRLSQALSINIPSMDPCLYILRFANRLDFGEKTHEVSMTALRLVQRMKRDSIHTGRRPSGLCGAALLMAARLHEFSRSVEDVIKIVKVHESTLRKRLMEFGETPSSALTLDEFMNVDLEEEQDPPSFKAARKKDRERLQKLMDEKDVHSRLNDLQYEIERQLDERKAKSRRLLNSAALPTPLKPGNSDTSGSAPDVETAEVDRFAYESTVGVIEKCLHTGRVSPSRTEGNRPTTPVGLGPSIASMGLLGDSNKAADTTKPAETVETGEIDLADIDDNEIDSYIMTDQEASNKDNLWMRVNADYLKELKEKEEKLKRDLEEGKPEKKKKKPSSKRGRNNCGPSSSTPEEAIQKMLQEKKISSKINYDVLKNLNNSTVEPASVSTKCDVPAIPEDIGSKTSLSVSDNEEKPAKKIKVETSPRVATAVRRGKVQPAGLPVVLSTSERADGTAEDAEDGEEVDEMDGEEEAVVETEMSGEMSLAQMLNQHRDDDDYYGGGYDDDDY